MSKDCGCMPRLGNHWADCDCPHCEESRQKRIKIIQDIVDDLVEADTKLWEEKFWRPLEKDATKV